MVDLIYMREKIFVVLLTVCVLVVCSTSTQAQDTLRIGLQEFISLALENSGQVKYDRTEVDLANNRVDAAKALRILPNLDYASEHAFVPGVSGSGNFPDRLLYLDPEARNDWSKFGLFTRARITGVQPLFTWGALSKAIKAAKIATEAAEQNFLAKQANFEVQLFDLYYSYVLAIEIERLVIEAEDKIHQIEEEMTKLQDEGEDVSDSDIFKFQIFAQEFETQKTEVKETLIFIRNSWKYILGRDNEVVFIPMENFINPLTNQLQTRDYYTNLALTERPEVKALDAGREALNMYVKSIRSSNRPALFFAFQTTLASTPIRPRQPNPFIDSPGNTFNTGFGFSIRQNLNFSSTRSSLERGKIEFRRIDYLKVAAQDGIMLEVGNAFTNAMVSNEKVQNTDKALKIAKEWLALELADTDLGFGEPKNLIDALRAELELKFKFKESVFEFNSNLAKLQKASGLVIQNLSKN